MTPIEELRRRVRALSQRERLLLLLGAVAILVFVVIRWGAYPALDSYRKSRAAIPQRTATLARYRLAAAGEANIDEAFADAAIRLEEMEEGMLPGDNPAAAGSALQGILKPWLERADSRLTSVRTLGPVQRGPYAEVAVQMDLQTTTEGLAALLRLIPYGRIGVPEDIGKVVAWLVSDDADYIHGQTIFVDGGMTLYPEFANGG